MKRTLNNYQFLQRVVKAYSSSFKTLIKTANEEEIKTLVECVINVKENKSNTKLKKLFHKSTDIPALRGCLAKHQTTVKSCVAFILYDILTCACLNLQNASYNESDSRESI